VKKRFSIVLCILVSLLILAFPVSAYALTYGVGGRDQSAEDYQQSYGTYGDIEVYNAYLPTSSSAHVGSMYVWDFSRQYTTQAEVGWVQSPMSGYSGSPQAFVAVDDYGYYGKALGNNLALGGHNFKVVNILGTNQFQFFADGNLLSTYTFTHVPFSYGTSTIGNERNTTQDDNYGHFWDLQVFKSNNTWSPWYSMTAYFNNDPNYYLDIISGSEAYVNHN
jgi:hypothetical protein